MDAIKVLQSVEEGVFEAALWPRAIWGTFWRALFKPWSAWYLVHDEWEKAAGERFRETISPILFWLIAVVLPYFVLMDRLLAAAAARHARLEFLRGQVWPVRFFVVAFFLAAGPLACARTIQRRGPQPGTRSELKRLFSTQCVALAPAYVFIMLLLLVGVSSGERSVVGNVLCIACVLSGTFAELAIVRLELRAGWLATLETVAACFTRWWLQVIVVLIVFAGLFVMGKGPAS
jgi:hypothetical protein